MSGDLPAAEALGIFAELTSRDDQMARHAVVAGVHAVLNMTGASDPLRRAALLRAAAEALMTEADALAPRPRPAA